MSRKLYLKNALNAFWSVTTIDGIASAIPTITTGTAIITDSVYLYY